MNLSAESTQTMKVEESDALLEEIKTRFDYALKEWAEIRDEGRIDMRYVAGDTWEPKDRAARRDAGRPCLSLDEIGQYTNQVINDLRANPRGMKFSPTTPDATEAGAEFYQNKARETEYRSHAHVAYITAAENMLQRSYGFCRLTTKFEDHTHDQEIWIEDVPNPDTILPDPGARKPDSSDMKWCFAIEERPYGTEAEKEAFKEQFPNATITDFSPYLQSHSSWVKANTITLAEYWKVKTRKRTLLLIQPQPMGSPNPLMAAIAPKPISVYADELENIPAGAKVLKQRVVDYPSVVQYLTNGVEILETKPWAGKYIPIASCYGKILYVDNGSGTKRMLMSMVRLMRDPAQLYNYYRTGQAEQVGMSTKFPFMSYTGQFSEDQKKVLAESLHKPVALLEANATTEATGQQVLPLPVRQIFEPAIQALEMGAEGARRSIQAGAGLSPLPTMAQRQNEKSGKALKNIEQSGQKGTFHFVDHFDGMIRHVGVMFEDLVDKIYDTARVTGTRKQNGDTDKVSLNDPNDPASVSTKGTYLVTVSTAPSFESEREEASAFTDGIVQSPVLSEIANFSGPKVAAAVLSNAIRLKNLGPYGEEMADMIMPTEFKAKEGQKPMPPEAQQAIAQLEQQLQQVSAAAQQMDQDLKSKASENDSKEKIAAAEIQSKERIASAEIESKERIADVESRRRAETAIAVAEIASKSKEPELFMQERERIGVQVENALDRTHEADLAELTHRQTLSENAQQADLGMVQAEHQQAIQPPQEADV